MPLMGKLRELGLYIIVAIGVIAGGLALAAFTSYEWYSFILFSALLAVVLAKMYWQARRVWRLWLLLALFMIAHTGVYVAVLQRVPNWPTISYVITGPLEIMLFATIAWFWLKVNPPLRGKF
jgi:hypothetical protein